MSGRETCTAKATRWDSVAAFSGVTSGRKFRAAEELAGETGASPQGEAPEESAGHWRCSQAVSKATNQPVKPGNR